MHDLNTAKFRSTASLSSHCLVTCETFWLALCSASRAMVLVAFFNLVFASLSSLLRFRTSCSPTVRESIKQESSAASRSCRFSTLLQEFAHACLLHLNVPCFKITTQLLYRLLHKLGVSFLGFPSDVVNVAFIQKHQIVLYKLKILLNGLVKDTLINRHRRGG